MNAKTAVASDLVASVFMRPVAGLIHLRRSVVRWPIVAWLVIGSVPTAFVSGIVSSHFVSSARADAVLEPVIGGVLIFSSAAAVARRLVARRRPAAPDPVSAERFVVRPLLTVAIGVLGGLSVGITSVGSGTLMLVGLALLYPSLSAYELVGTDLIQAIPLVLAAAGGHLAAGGLHVVLTSALVAGGVPGAAIGAAVAKYVPAGTLGAIVAAVIFGSGCALIGLVPGALVGAGAALACAALAWRLVARHRAVAQLAAAGDC